MGGTAEWTTSRRPGADSRSVSDKSLPRTASVHSIMAKIEFFREAGVSVRHVQTNHSVYSSMSVIGESILLVARRDIVLMQKPREEAWRLHRVELLRTSVYGK